MIQIDAVAAAGDVGVASVIGAVGARLEGVVTGVVEALEGEHGAVETRLRGVVVDHIQDHLEPGLVQLAHHGLELGHRLLRRIARLGGEEGDGVVAPVVGQPQLLEPGLGHEGRHRHQLHRGDAKRLEVLDDERVADAQIGAAQLARHPLMLAGEALDVGFIDDGAGRLDGGLAHPLPVEGVIHHHGFGHHGGTVPLIEGVIPVGRATERLGVGVDQQLVRVEQHPLLGRAVHPITVALTGLDAAHMAEAVLATAAGQLEAGQLPLLLVEQAELHLVRLRRPYAEVTTRLVEQGPQRMVLPLFHCEHQDSCLMNKVASGGRSSTMLCAIPCQGVGSATKTRPTS